MAGTCPTTEQLAAALRGIQTPAAEAELAAHLAECPACRARLEELAGGSSWVETRAKAHAASAKSASEFLHQAMQVLESRSGADGPQPAAQVRLDFLQPSDQPGVLGRFGPYEVLAPVAAGGMGIVLKARDPGLNRIVALKILPPALAANSLARARFIREARAAAAVVHEHVVPIYAVDEFAGLPYLVMQFILGRPLSERIRATGPLRLEEILRIGVQMAAGLAAAHAQGLIHRDVKPGNILLENSVERVKITDFGLARAADDSSLTHDGHIAGTPEYMSPEQARNEPVDHRSDLFSFGCVLYEMATGISPFRAEKPLVAMRRVCDEEPPPAHTLNRRIPEALSELIQGLMAKNLFSRPPSAAHVAEELNRRLAKLQQTSDAPGSVGTLGNVRRMRLALASVLGAMMLVSLLVVISLWREDSAEADSPPAVRLDEERSAEAPPGQAASLFFLPASGDVEERGFASLAEAVQAAPAGGVIECRFNGPEQIPTLRLRDKPLLIRAAPGFGPVLTQAEPDRQLLISDSALVLEGVTLLMQSMSRDGGRGAFATAFGVLVEDGPFLATHCRFEFAPDSLRTRPFPPFVSLANVPVARILHCEFVCGEGFGLDWRLRPSSTPRETAVSLVVQDSTAEGNLILVLRRGRQALRLDLQRNTVSGQSLVALRDPIPGVPLDVHANNNVFAVDMLANPVVRAGEAPIENLLRWQGQSNAYAVMTFTNSSRSKSYEEWLASSAVTETNSVTAELAIQARLEKSTERSRSAAAVAFLLTAEERRNLSAHGWTSPDPPGADPMKTGPGQSYHAWRNSPAYADWQKLVREHLRPSAPIE